VIAAGRPGRERLTLDERDSQAATGELTRARAPDHASAHDDDVRPPHGESLRCPPYTCPVLADRLPPALVRRASRVYLWDVQGVLEGPRRDLATWCVVAGVITTLSGLVADLIAHAANPQAHAHEELITFGSGNNPWHLVLFAGILITAVGGILWVSRLRSEAGAVIGAIMVVLLVAAVAVGGWTGWRNANAGSSQALASGTHAHHAAGNGGSAHANHAVVSGEGAEGASHHAGKAGPVTPAQR
jgi:hypothetical protein